MDAENSVNVSWWHGDACMCGRPSSPHQKGYHLTPSATRSEVVEDTIASIPTRFRWARFGDIVQLAQRVRPSSAIDKAVAEIDGGAETFVLVGQAGVGKTSLGCAMLRRLAKRLERKGVFADAIDLAYARKQHKLGDGEAPEVKEAMHAGVLFIDEVGAEQGADQTIEQIIRLRHNWQRPTIYGTPHQPDAIRKRYGDGVARRMFEGAVIIHLEAVGRPGAGIGRGAA